VVRITLCAAEEPEKGLQKRKLNERLHLAPKTMRAAIWLEIAGVRQSSPRKILD
jgi:hypothetical protein